MESKKTKESDTDEKGRDILDSGDEKGTDTDDKESYSGNEDWEDMFLKLETESLEKDHSSMYESFDPDVYDSYFKESDVRNHIKSMVPAMLDKKVMYLARIKPFDEKLCKYYIGYSNNILDSVGRVCDRFICSNRFELLALKEVKSQHEVLTFKYDMISGSGKVEDDMWCINEEVYRRFIENCDYLNQFYEFKDGQEMYTGAILKENDHVVFID